MGTIADLHNPWRDALVPAAYDGNEFFVEMGAREGGHRLVIHEFPKKDDPYTEHMGRRYIAFTVRAYCIQSPIRRDYRPERDALQNRLDDDSPGSLQLPSTPPMKVYCQRYRMMEEEKLGGYVVFDIQFVEVGTEPLKPTVSAQSQLLNQAGATQAQTLSVMSEHA